MSDVRNRDGRPRIPLPPIPAEHGTWAILFGPFLAGAAIADGGRVATLAWLFAAILAIYLGRAASVDALRPRHALGARGWAAFLLAFGTLSCAVLVVSFGATDLLLVAACVATLFLFHTGLSLLTGARRADRTLTGELIAVAALTLSAPAAFAVSDEGLSSRAWLVWAANLVYYAGGVFYVRMWLSAAKQKRGWSQVARMTLAAPIVFYHFAMAGCGALLPDAGWAFLAVAPATARSLVGAALLSPNLPKLTRVGALEASCAVWFTGVLIAAF